MLYFHVNKLNLIFRETFDEKKNFNFPLNDEAVPCLSMRHSNRRHYMATVDISNNKKCAKLMQVRFTVYPVRFNKAFEKRDLTMQIYLTWVD